MSHKKLASLTVYAEVNENILKYEHWLRFKIFDN
jgi:hypothetical protein